MSCPREAMLVSGILAAAKGGIYGVAGGVAPTSISAKQYQAEPNRFHTAPTIFIPTF
jgi:hypothetical protein